MPERARLQLRGGGTLDVYPLDGPTFDGDLHQALNRSDGGEQILLTCRTADGHRTTVRMSEVQAVTVQTYDLDAIPLRPANGVSGPIPWPPPLEYKDRTT